MKRWYIFPVLILMAVSVYAVDFDTEIQPIFTSTCVGCHGTSGGLSLVAGQAYGNLVDVVSQGYSPAQRVTPGDPSASVLYNKVAGTGVNGQRMPVGGTLTTAQIQLISDWITELGAETPITIAEARALPDGTPVIVQGIITATTWGTPGVSTQAVIQDETGGMVIYAGSFDAGLLIGDEVQVSGDIDIYSGLIEIAPSSLADIEVLSSGNDLPEIQVLSIPEINSNGVMYESEYVRLDSVTITGGTWPTNASSVNMTIADANGVTITMRIDGDTDLKNHEAMLGYFNLTGIVGRYNASFQIFPRFYSDLEQIGDPTPLITNILQTPASPTPANDVTVSAMIVDNNEVVSAALNYTVDGGIEMVVAMIAGEDDLYSGIIPAQAGDAVVSYTISATDNYDGVSTSNAFSYIVYSGNVSSIASLQDGTIPAGTSVTVQGYVTAEPYAFYPADDLHYYFIQDAQAPYSGVKVYDPGRALAYGDEVRLTGTVDEYFDVTEILNITEFELLSHGHGFEPMVIGLDADMEMYEGCLVQIQDVTVSDPDQGFGEWLVTDGTTELRLDDAADYFYTPVQDEAFAAITGVLEYAFGSFRLLPRLASDLEFASGLTRIQAIQQVRYSDLLPHYGGLDSTLYFADTSYYYAGWTDSMIVTIQGIVTMPTGLSYAGNGIKFIVQDIEGGPWSSILSYHPDSTAYPVLFEGDLIRMQGYISEYVTPEGNSTSNMTEFFITSEIELLEVELEVPEEPVVATGDLRWPTTAEQWGNVVVKIENATILENNPTAFDILKIDDGSGSVLVDDDSDSLAFGAYIQPPAGEVYESVRGWVYHHFGTYLDSSTYKVVPLYQEDLVLSTVSIDNLVVPDGYALGNYPNPFNPTTTIAFRIPQAHNVHLIIYNQLGQQVVTLMDKSLAAGSYDVVWNGLDAKGKPVSSGLYFYRLVAGPEQLVGKMTYLK